VDEDLRERERSVAAFYDAYGADREWARFETPLGAVRAHVVAAFLGRWVRPGERVLDAGSGPGRFALLLARRGARVTLLDISSVLLDDARRRFAAEGLTAEAFLRRSLFDVDQDLGRFDVVLCLGGALDYYEGAMDRALHLLRDRLAPGGRLVGSVMSTVGGLASALHAGWLPEPAVGGGDLRRVWADGIVTPAFSEHAAKMLTAQELAALLGRSALDLCDMSATDCLLALPQEQLLALAGRGDLWAALLELEVDACRRMPEAGGHILFAAEAAEAAEAP